MELNERQRQILDILKRQKKVSVKSLSETLYASQMTIRRDLTNLSSSGLLTRYHGGAVVKEDDKQQPINVRHFIDDGEKKLLAQQAVRYLSDDMLVFIDCSSTCSYIIPYLKNFSKIRVVTNSVHVLLLLADAHIPCSVAGGYYYEPEMCMIGRETEEFLSKINPDVAFFSFLGISRDGRITDNNEAITSVRRSVIKNAAKVVCLLDSAKLNCLYTYTVCTTKDVDVIIT